jgi:hypothetical protein
MMNTPTVQRPGIDSKDTSSPRGSSSTSASEPLAPAVRTLYNNTTGFNNIAVGYQAGYNLTTGNNNVEIGSLGTAADANAIRIGTQGTQKATYIAGIYGTPMRGADVVVSSNGHLGVLPSSARYKKDIHSLNNRSQGLWQLRPVTFRYKQDPQGERQYGLIAEQVAASHLGESSENRTGWWSEGNLNPRDPSISPSCSVVSSVRQ